MSTEPEMVHGVYSIALIKAVLLLAEQVHRVGNAIEEKIEEDAGNRLENVIAKFSLNK